MPDLQQSFQNYDLGQLRIIAEAWEIELNAPDFRSALKNLVSEMVEPGKLNILLKDLTDDSIAALNDMRVLGGRIPWAFFTRRYGQLREIGPAKRDRERLYLRPTSITEYLWYRGLIGRGFFGSTEGLLEYAYIPDDLLALFPLPLPTSIKSLGRSVPTDEPLVRRNANDCILDDVCTLLANLRSNLPEQAGYQSLRATDIDLKAFLAFLTKLLRSSGILGNDGIPLSDPTRMHFEASRSAAWTGLVKTWLESSLVNELDLAPGFSREGVWKNDPVLTRRNLLTLLEQAPGQKSKAGVIAGIMDKQPERAFVSITSFIQAVHDEFPDFQRPEGDYDSWFFRVDGTNDSLRGFNHWFDVEGELIRFMLIGPMHWLGLVDLAAKANERKKGKIEFTAFRLSTFYDHLLSGISPPIQAKEEERFLIRSDGRIIASRLFSRAIRYQLARFCVPEGIEKDLYRYCLSPESLARARQQGLRVNHLLGLFNRFANAVPPSLLRALERWEQQGSEIIIENPVVLRVRNPEILQAIRASRAAKYLGDPLGPAAIVIKTGAVDTVIDILVELGYFGESLIVK